MYDIIKCEYPLPLSGIDEDDLRDIEKGMGESSWPEVEWQTKDFENNLDVYTIEDDGQIYQRDTQWVLDAESNRGMSPTEGGEIQKYEKTAEVILSSLFLGDDFDYWIEFKVTFWKGDLKEIELHEFSREDSTERKKHQKEKKLPGVKQEKPK